ncbi:MAG: winged helix DNA-binding protein [Bacteroides sp.]
MKTICKMREVLKALAQFETAFEKEYLLTLNEAMVLCALEEAKGKITSTAIAERIGMCTSLASKNIRSVEDMGLIERTMGQTDKRQMYFSLTPAGELRLQELTLDKVEVPDLLKPVLV